MLYFKDVVDFFKERVFVLSYFFFIKLGIFKGLIYFLIVINFEFCVMCY